MGPDAPIRVGCAGWSYRDWVGPVYPPRSGPEEWLPIYTRLFDTVEVDATFYAIPDPHTVRGWIRKTEHADGFTFSAKVPQDATHTALPARDTVAMRRVAREFVDTVIRPLEDAARFEAAVVQLPPSFRAEPNSPGASPLLDLVALVEELAPRDRHVVVEFRHRSWFRRDEALLPEAEAALADLGAAVARIDGLGSTFTSTRTTPWSYHRLHGRRRSIPPEERGLRWAPYDYEYGAQETAELKAAIAACAREDERTIVIFHNHYEGKAARNAADLLAAMHRPRPRLPATPAGTPRLEEFG